MSEPFRQISLISDLLAIPSVSLGRWPVAYPSIGSRIG
jgi:hypothetical protein